MFMKNWKLTPNTLELLKRLMWFLVFMQLTRLLFFIYNRSIFLKFSFTDFLGGLWFDLVTFNLIALPYILLQSLPFKFRGSKIYRFLLNSIYYLVIFVTLGLNLVDVEYYKHSNRRSTMDMFSIATTGNDFQQQLGSFFKDFWFLFFMMAVFLAVLAYIHKKTYKVTAFTSYWKETLTFFLTVGIAIILGRGGFGLRPITPLNASYFTESSKVGLVLNTPFTVIKSYGKKQLEIPTYFSDSELTKHYQPIQKTQPQHIFKGQKNVVIILLESFGAEFVGAAGAENSFTPFLDSLAANSLNFKHGISNGKRSIEAIPAIYSSIPTWMDEAYITSPYSNNAIRSLAAILGENNYETAFFHGATNGSMRFDAYTKQVGVNHYFGRAEYKNDQHFDGTWGIIDEEFLPWSARKMTELKAPFFSTIFTLSSHHPYYVPQKWKGKLKKGPHPLAETINYTDESLRLFFKEAQKQTWFNETIFVFVADHTPAAVAEKYAAKNEIFHIPIFIYDPSETLVRIQSDRYFQQIDIFPTVLDLLNIETTFFSFGNSYFKAKNEGMSYLEGNYYYFFDKHLMTFQNNESRSLENIKANTYPIVDSLQYYRKVATKNKNTIKAMIQTYNQALVQNSMNQR